MRRASAAGIRQGSQLQLGQADPRALPRQAEVAGEGQLQTSAQAVAGHRGDDRLAHLLDGGQHAQALIEQLIHAALAPDSLAHLLQVHAHREVLLPRTADDQGAN
jgi:hypothetical protein